MVYRYICDNKGDSWLIVRKDAEDMLLKDDWADIAKMLIDGYSYADILAFVNNVVEVGEEEFIKELKSSASYLSIEGG